MKLMGDVAHEIELRALESKSKGGSLMMNEHEKAVRELLIVLTLYVAKQKN